MEGTYWVIRSKATGKIIGPPGVSSAPHLYMTKGRASGQVSKWHKDDFEIVPVHLTELKIGVTV